MTGDDVVFWHVTANTVFTVGTTLLVFIAGLTATRYFESKKEKKRLSGLHIFHSQVLKAIQKQVTKQIEESNKFIQQLTGE